jgi:NAD(P)-dependent dehydrogenase (short-subunit alcohol dehydrogenase family)
MVIPDDYVPQLFRLDGRKAVVTGAGSGIGSALAIGLAQAGARLELLDVNEQGLAETKELIEAQGGQARSWPCDVTDSASLAAAEAGIHADDLSASILVNSAGTAVRYPAEDFPETEFDRILALNLKGTFLPSQVFGRGMLKVGGGSIINIASIGGFVAYPWASAYLASKGGVVQLTRSLALEWGPRGVRVNGIGPTLMDSPLVAKAAQSTSITADFIKSRMIQPRLGLPKELIGAAIFLASDASSLVNGHTLMCDDGYLVA